MNLEYGRKILPHLFKRNNYKTISVGKDQPMGNSFGTKNDEGTDYYYVEGMD